MWQLSVEIELHELFKKLILESLANPASSGAVERRFSQCNIRSANRKNRMSPKTWKFWFIMSKLKFKLSKFFHFFRKYTRFYTIFRNTRIHVTVLQIHEIHDTRQFTAWNRK